MRLFINMNNDNNKDYEIKNLPNSKIVIFFDVVAESITSEISILTKEKAKDISVPGFRKGKAPLDIAVQNINMEKIISHATALVINRKYDNILKENNIIALSSPILDKHDKGPDGTIKVSITVDVLPKIEIKNEKNLKTKIKPIGKITKEYIDDVFKSLQKMFATTEDKGKDAIIEDSNIIHIKIKDLTKEEKEESFILPMRKKEVSKKFYDFFLGKKINEKIIVDYSSILDFKLNHDVQKLKKKEYEIKIVLIEKQILPKIDDDFIKKHFASEENIKDIDSFIENIKIQKKIDMKRSNFQDARKEFIKKLMENASEVEMPKEVIKKIEKEKIEKLRETAKKSGLSESEMLRKSGILDISVEDFAKEVVTKDIVLTACYAALLELKKIKIPEENIIAEIKNILLKKEPSLNPEILEKETKKIYKNDKQVRRKIVDTLLEKKILDIYIEDII